MRGAVRRWGLMAGATAIVLGAGLAFRPHRAAIAAAPWTPGDDRDVVEVLAAGATDPRTRELAALRRALAAEPRNVALATRLAREDVTEARARSDPRYLGYAQAALAPWWDAADAPAAVLVLRATIRQSLHDFDGALADLDRALRLDPDDAQAWLTRGVILAVRGDLPAARAACDRIARRVSALSLAACFEGVRALGPEAAAAYDALGRALVDAGDAPPAERAWVETTLGEIAARRGDVSAAEAHFGRVLAIDGRDAYALGALADLLLDAGRPREVLPRLAGFVANDGLLLRLAFAERAVGDPRAAAHVATVAERFEASRARGDVVHRREEARFRLAEGDVEAALRLARANFDVQREPWDVRVLLEAALAAKDREAARPALEHLARTGLDDARLRGLARKLEER